MMPSLNIPFKMAVQPCPVVISVEDTGKYDRSQNQMQPAMQSLSPLTPMSHGPGINLINYHDTNID